MRAEDLFVMIEFSATHPNGSGWYYSLNERMPAQGTVTHDVRGPFKSTTEAVKDLAKRGEPGVYP